MSARYVLVLASCCILSCTDSSHENDGLMARDDGVKREDALSTVTFLSLNQAPMGVPIYLSHREPPPSMEGWFSAVHYSAHAEQEIHLTLPFDANESLPRVFRVGDTDGFHLVNLGGYDDQGNEFFAESGLIEVVRDQDRLAIHLRDVVIEIRGGERKTVDGLIEGVFREDCSVVKVSDPGGQSTDGPTPVMYEWRYDDMWGSRYCSSVERTGD